MNRQYGQPKGFSPLIIVIGVVLLTAAGAFAILKVPKTQKIPDAVQTTPQWLQEPQYQSYINVLPEKIVLPDHDLKEWKSIELRNLKFGIAHAYLKIPQDWKVENDPPADGARLVNQFDQEVLIINSLANPCPRALNVHELASSDSAKILFGQLLSLQDLHWVKFPVTIEEVETTRTRGFRMTLPSDPPTPLTHYCMQAPFQYSPTVAGFLDLQHKSLQRFPYDNYPEIVNGVITSLRFDASD